MRAGEAGVKITIKATVNLNPATKVELFVRGPNDPQPRALAATASGTNGLRTTLVTDFPVEGNYLIQLIASFPAGKELKSPVKQLFVGGRLD